MEIRLTRSFEKDYRELSHLTQKAVDKKLLLLLENFKYPSLRTENEMANKTSPVAPHCGAQDAMVVFLVKEFASANSEHNSPSHPRRSSAGYSRTNSNKKTTEVEVRGPLTREDFLRVKKFFDENAVPKGKKERVLIDYSIFIPDQHLEKRQKDIRLRTTNGVPEIILKLGSWGGNENREEISVCANGNSFDDLVRVFGAMGFEKGMLCVRNSLVYDFEGVEFVLVEVPNHSYYFEAEIMCVPDRAVSARKKILEAVERLGLRVFAKDEFFSYIKTLNREVNKIFDFSKYRTGDFAKKFGV